MRVLLFTEDIHAAKQEIVASGGRITQQFTDRVFVAELPESVVPQALRESTPDEPGALDEVSRLAAAAWKRAQEKQARATPSETEGLSWDTPGFSPPDADTQDDGG